MTVTQQLARLNYEKLRRYQTDELIPDKIKKVSEYFIFLIVTP